jgi:hypothetical protein
MTTGRSFTFSTVIALSVFSASVARADEERLPPKVQAVMFKKIFQFDRELESRDTKVAVIHTDDSVGEAEKMVAAFQDLSIDAKLVKASSAEARLSEVSVA